MSELGLPFDGADADASGDRRRKLIVIAAVAVLLVLAGVLLVPKLLGGDAEPAARPAAKPGSTTVKKPAPAKKKPVAKKKPKPFNGAIARDPFDAPYTPNSEKAKSAVAASPAAGGGTTPTGGTGTTAPTTHTFTLLAVSGSGSKVTVDVLFDSKTYAGLVIGQRFIEDQFKVVTAASQCASFLYGDKEFALCEGEQQAFTSS